MNVRKIVTSEVFLSDYEKLKDVSLSPDRHTAPTAYEHCEMVRNRIGELVMMNYCTPEEIDLLVLMAFVHDIGKINGTSYPSASVDLLPKYGIVDEHLTQLVKYHDTSLSWYHSYERGEAPSSKAWRKLASKLDMWLLCLFMVADRADAPGGWQENDATIWFIDEANERGYLNSRPLHLDASFLVEVDHG